MSELKRIEECIGLMEFDIERGALEKSEWNIGRIEGLKMAVAILNGKSAGEVY